MPPLDPELQRLIEAAKEVAIGYRKVTGRPLGITGEIGELVAAHLLGLKLSEVRSPGYDAVHPHDGRRVQIKTRCLGADCKRGQQVGSIRLQHPWDSVMLLILDESYEPRYIVEADRAKVQAALEAPGSIARNVRGALSVSKFRSIGKRVWPPEG